MFRHRPHVIVIGSGVGGLSAGAYLARNGFGVTVYERMKQAGGFVHNFKRKGFVFEASTHYLTGMSAEGYLLPSLKMLGLERLPVREHATPLEFIMTRDQAVVWRNLLTYVDGSLRRVLIDQFSHSQEALERFFADIAATGDDLLRLLKLQRVNPLLRPLDLAAAMALKHAPANSVIQRLGMRHYQHLVTHRDHSAADFLAAITDKRLSQILSAPCFVLGEKATSTAGLVYAVMMFTMFCRRTCSLVGGTQQLIDGLVDQIKRHGGELRLGEEITEIQVEGGAAVGVRTRRGATQRAAAVVSNATAHVTFGDLIPPDFSLDAELRQRLDAYEPSPSCFQTYLGLPFDPRDYGFHAGSTFFLSEDMDAALEGDITPGPSTPFIMTNYASTNPELCSGNRASVALAEFDDIQRWQNLPEDRYREQKRQTQALLVQKAQALTGMPLDRAEVCFSGTPRTMAHYSGDPHGGIVGAAVNLRQGGINRFQYQTPIPGLYLVGADAIPSGGVSPCLDSGILAAKLLTKNV